MHERTIVLVHDLALTSDVPFALQLFVGPQRYRYVRQTDYGSGACLMAPRKLFRDLRLPDLRYRPAFYDDTDASFAIRHAG